MLRRGPGFLLIVDKLIGQAVSLFEQGDMESAFTLCEEAAELDPENDNVWYLIGAIEVAQGHLAGASEAYLKSVELEPQSIRNLEAYARVLADLGQYEHADRQYERLLAMAPERADWWAILSGLKIQTGDPNAAEAAAHRATALDPTLPEPLINLALIYQAKADLDAATAFCRQAIECDGGFSEAHFTLGVIYLARGWLQEAIACFECVLEISPEDPEALINIGNVYRERMEIAAAGSYYQRAAERSPDMAPAHSNLGIVLKDQGKMDAALTAFRRSLELDPDNHLARSNLLFCLCFNVEEDLGAVFDEHLEYDRRHAAPLMPDTLSYDVEVSSGRPLRIGLLSPDLRVHPGGHFYLPIVEGLKRKGHEVVCYYNFHACDDWTEKFQSAAAKFYQVHQWSDDRLAATIKTDRIDILFEGAGHMSGNRLLAVARRPAPVQVGTALYPNTTGLTSIDYRLLDERVALPEAEKYHSEKIIRLPETHFCYRPLDIDVKPAGRTPARENGFVTFGSFNNAIKLNDVTVAVWSRVLRKIPNARLVLKWLEFDRPESAIIVDRFAAHGIDRDRIIRFGRSPDPYTSYRELDICLDPILASGGTTTCDALWMGVPVVTYSGETQFARTGLMHLTNIGLPQLVASDSDAFVRIAVGLANDLDALEHIRNDLRGRMLRSPIMDEERYIDFLDAELRRIWTDWCDRQVRPPADLPQ